MGGWCVYLLDGGSFLGLDSQRKSVERRERDVFGSICSKFG